MSRLAHDRLVQLLLDRARGRMKPRRLLHVLGVTHVAASFAPRHGLDPEAAGVAALLHDQSKEIDPEIILAEMAAFGSPIPEDDLTHPRVWHGPHAAAWAAAEVGLNDAAVLAAGALHTTADDTAGPLTRLLFVADFCEPTRRREATGQVLGLLYDDLDEAFRLALYTKARHMMRDHGFVFHSRSRRAIAAWLDGPRRAELEQVTNPSPS